MLVVLALCDTAFDQSHDAARSASKTAPGLRSATPRIIRAPSTMSSTNNDYRVAVVGFVTLQNLAPAGADECTCSILTLFILLMANAQMQGDARTSPPFLSASE